MSTDLEVKPEENGTNETSDTKLDNNKLAKLVRMFKRQILVNEVLKEEVERLQKSLLTVSKEKNLLLNALIDQTSTNNKMAAGTSKSKLPAVKRSVKDRPVKPTKRMKSGLSECDSEDSYSTEGHVDEDDGDVSDSKIFEPEIFHDHSQNSNRDQTKASLVIKSPANVAHPEVTIKRTLPAVVGADGYRSHDRLSTCLSMEQSAGPAVSQATVITNKNTANYVRPVISIRSINGASVAHQTVKSSVAINPAPYMIKPVESTSPVDPQKRLLIQQAKVINAGPNGLRTTYAFQK